MDQPSTTTTINKTELPPWVDQAAQQNLQMANQIAAKPYQPFTGSLTAQQTDLGQAANNSAMADLTAYQPQMAQASATTAQGLTYQPKSFLNMNVQDYMNPYIQNVENAALTNSNQAFQQNLNGISADAVSAGAFGGSRQGVSEGVAAAENARQMGDLSAQLRAQGYDTATQLMSSDADRAMQGQQMQQNAAAQLGQLAQAGSDMNAKNTTLAATLGEQQRQVDQQSLQEQYAKWQDAQQADLRGLNLRLAAVGATPYGSTQTQTSTGAGGGNQAMGLAGGILGLLPFMFSSDRNEKTDIKKLGKDPQSGVPLYSYRYKGDPKSYPKVVGPMAQDLEKIVPSAVKKLDGGSRIVMNLGFGGSSNRLPAPRIPSIGSNDGVTVSTGRRGGGFGKY